MDIKEFAKLVLELLETQTRYFRAAPSGEKEALLTWCRQTEGRMKKMCRDLIAGRYDPGLFPTE